MVISSSTFLKEKYNAEGIFEKLMTSSPAKRRSLQTDLTRAPRAELNIPNIPLSKATEGPVRGLPQVLPPLGVLHQAKILPPQTPCQEQRRFHLVKQGWI
jgi:hypothetical protein